MYLPPEFIEFCIFAGVVAILIGLMSSRSRISRSELLGCWKPAEEVSQLVQNEFIGNRTAKLCLYENGEMLMETVSIDDFRDKECREHRLEGTWSFQSPFILCRNLPDAEEHGTQLRIKVHQFDRGELILSSGKERQRWARCEECNTGSMARDVNLIQ
ncbi:MAG: hypothetical protein VX738_14810 [Planctomycetota bacterium]|nr:hypothetical protein [Planctomycetota bacterium]